MRRQELSGSVQCGGRFVEDRVIGLEDVGDPRGNVEGDLDVGGGGLLREPEQASAAAIVVLAVPWGNVRDAVQDLEWNEQVVIDATNDFDPSDLNGRTSSEVVATLVSPARVVKGANTLGAAVLASGPHEAGGRRGIFLSGDDVDAKSNVIALFEDAGFVAIDLGDLVTGGVMQQVRGPLAGST